MIEFVNIRTNERVSLTRPHQIGAFINSSDLHPNASKGQDFGWRLSPELVVKIEDMSQDPEMLDKIALRTGTAVEEITTIQIAQYLSSIDDLDRKTREARAARNPEFKKAYEAEIEALKYGETQIVMAPVVVTPVALPVVETPVQTDIEDAIVAPAPTPAAKPAPTAKKK